MKKFSLTLFLIIVALFAQSAAAQKQYKTYTNVRFEYSVSYPSDLLKPQGEADNGDGQVFKSDDGTTEMRVYGGYNALNQTMKQIYQDAINDVGAANVTYKILQANLFVVSGKNNDKIYYRKTVRSGDRLLTFSIEYDAANKPIDDAVTAKIANSLKSRKSAK